MTPVNKFLSYEIFPVDRAIQPTVFPSFRQEFSNRVCEKLEAPTGENTETGFSKIKRSCELDATSAPVSRRNSSLRENSFRFWLYVQVYQRAPCNATRAVFLLFRLHVSQRGYLNTKVAFALRVCAIPAMEKTWRSSANQRPSNDNIYIYNL